MQGILSYGNTNLKECNEHCVQMCLILQVRMVMLYNIIIIIYDSRKCACDVLNKTAWGCKKG